MKSGLRQMALDWRTPPSFALQDFLPRPGNQQALDMILRWPDWPKPVLLLSGVAGSGKTHLAEIWRDMTKAEPLGGLDNIPDAPLVVENAHLVAAENEQGLFDLLAHRLMHGPDMLLTSPLPAGHWEIEMPDLRSRIRALPHNELALPDDALLQAMMIKFLRERHINIKPQAIRYILGQIERSPTAVLHAARLLGQAAAAKGGAVTLALAREFFPEI